MLPDWSIDKSSANSIRCLFSDVDGVLTDGRLVYDSQGAESKAFHVRDGLAIKRWITAGNSFVIVTARQSKMVDRRAAELGIQTVIQDCRDKTAACQDYLNKNNLSWSQSAYIGDDIADIGPIQRCGFGVVPKDGCRDAVDAADCVMSTAGGQGVVRELIETIMRAAGSWPLPPKIDPNTVVSKISPTNDQVVG